MGDKVADYIWCAGIIIGTLLLKRPMANLITRLSSTIAMRLSYAKYRGKIRSMLAKPIERLLQTILYYIAIHEVDNFLDHFVLRRFIGMKQRVNIKLGDVLDHVFLFLFIVFLTQVITRFIDFVYYLRMGKAHQQNDYARMQLLPLTKEIAKLVIWTLSIFWILGQVFMVNIPALITGLGIGGVAIALAGKETIENFFAAFTILSDKPFKTGDTIKQAEIEGVVERIGFRSTRVRATDGSAHIIPNQKLVSQNLINQSMRDLRVMKVVAHVRYGVSHEVLVLIITKIREELLNETSVKEPVEAVVESFEKETFQLVVSYNLPHPLPDSAKLNDIKHDINMRVFAIISSHATLGTPIGSS
jgi:MscS family membrane protein